MQFSTFSTFSAFGTIKNIRYGFSSSSSFPRFPRFSSIPYPLTRYSNFRHRLVRQKWSECFEKAVLLSERSEF